MKPVKNKLRVSHFPQIPCKPFSVEVKDEEQALLIRDTLVNQHLFLFDNNMIPDYSSAITVEMWDENSDGEGNADWVDYYNENEQMDFDEYVGKYLISGQAVMIKIFKVLLEDNGQDLIGFTVKGNGEIIDCHSHGVSVFVGGYIPINEQKIGHPCMMHYPPDFEYDVLKYNVVAITEIT